MPSPPKSDPKQFVQGAPVLHVPDVEATARYYRDVLGFTWDFGDATYAVVWRDNSAIHLMQGEGSPSGMHLFQWIRNVDALLEEIAEGDAEIVEGPADRAYGVRELVIRDLNGVRIVFGQDLPEGPNQVHRSG